MKMYPNLNQNIIKTINNISQTFKMKNVNSFDDPIDIIGMSEIDNI